jgi:nitrite reductase (NO-forming)
MAKSVVRERISRTWPAAATGALRVGFGIIWAVSAAITWMPGFADHYVGYLHNAAQGQPAWLAGWFAMWIGLVTPHAMLFVWLTRWIETLIAFCLLAGFARKSVYVAGALFSLLIWSTAGGFGGPYTVGAANMGAGLAYVLIFAALIGIDNREGRSPYSLDYFVERRWPRWRRFAEWGRGPALEREPQSLPWVVQIPAIAGIAVLVIFLIGGLKSSFNVKPPTPAAAAAAVTPLALASSNLPMTPYDASLPPLKPGNTVNVHLIASDDTVAIADGVSYRAWTFNGTVPGPIIHVRQGQTVNVTFTNHGHMLHSIDFHSAQTPPNLHYKDIGAGESIHFSYTADVPGVFIYHCGTAPTLQHIANGMYGAIVVDPAKPLPHADESYVLVQGEWYTRQVSGTLMGQDFAKMQAIAPDEVTFNGIAFQYKKHPLHAKVGDRVRFYVVNAGPSVWSAFHLIGEIFDKVYLDGDAANALSGVSTWSVGPGEGMIFDVTVDQAGQYTFVDHSMAHAYIGAQGVLDVQ